MASKNPSGTMVLPTHSATALWVHEIKEQLSDGHWENSTPRNHYSFWCSLTVTVEPWCEPKVVTDGYALRTNYNLRALFDLGKDCSFRYDIRDRMVRLGRLALASARLGRPQLTYDQRIMAKDMPETLGIFRTAKTVAVHPREIEKYAAVDDELATVYYTQPDVVAYGLKQMKADVDAIKAAMMTVRI